MTRSLAGAVVATGILVLLAAPSAFAARGFSHGVAAGEMSASSAVLWAKAAKSGRYKLAGGGQ
jgi:phosphodiesterase/alkaline phosphatase D-like protein